MKQHVLKYKVGPLSQFFTISILLLHCCLFTLSSAQESSNGNTTREEETSNVRPQPFVMFANKQLIRRVDLNESNFRQIPTGNLTLNNTVAIDYDLRRNYLFWSDVYLKQIVRARLDGSGPEVLVDNGLSVADGLAWDWINEKLYWTDSKHYEIEVLDIARGHRTQVVYCGRDSKPRALIVDPNTRYMYWTDWGKPAKIERAYMDGSSREILHNTSLVWPNGITIDYATQTLYWIDANLDKIESSSVDGSSRTLISTQFILHPFSISFYNNVLYWSDWAFDQVVFAPVSSPGNVAGLVPGLPANPMGVKVVALDAQPINSSNPCTNNNGGCSHLCLLGASGNTSTYSCQCPLGLTLQDNGRYCYNRIPTTSTPTVRGSCRAAGYNSCCTDDPICEGSTPDCFCDVGCHFFEDCCDDFSEICNVSETTLSPLPPFPTSSSTVPSQSSSLLNPSLTVSRTANGLEYTNSIGMIPSSLTDASTRTRSRHLSSHIVTPTLSSVYATSTFGGFSSVSVSHSEAISSSTPELSATPTLGTSRIQVVREAVIATVLAVLVLIAALVLVLVIVVSLKRRKAAVAKYEIFENNQEGNGQLQSSTRELSYAGSTDSGVDLKLDSEV